MVATESMTEEKEKNKEIILASEDVQRRNLKTTIEFCTKTRKMVLELGTIVNALQDRMIVMDANIAEHKNQLSLLQAAFYKAGTTSYSDNQD